MAPSEGYPARVRSQYPRMDPATLMADYESREPLYTEGDYLRRFAEIKNARAVSIAGISAENAPGDRMVALLASGRVGDAEYFKLAALLGVDSSGLIYSEPPGGHGFAWFLARLRAVWRAVIRAVARMRRA